MMKPMRTARSTVLVLLASLASCGKPATTDATEGRDAKIATAQSDAPIATCAGGAARLPATQLCPDAAKGLLVAAPGVAATPPENCAWAIQDVSISSDQAVLYRAARCQVGTAKLAFAPGEPMGTFTLAKSPYEGGYDISEPIVWMTKAAGNDALLTTARRFIRDPKEAARCQVRPAAIEGWPADALVIDEVPRPQSDEVRTACGKFGLDEDSQTFWRLSQGTGWFFQLGQESPIVDAGSFTLARRGTDGQWRRAKPL